MTTPSIDPRFKAPEFVIKLRELIQTSKYLYRDTSLSPQELQLYRVGTFFREPSLFDCTARFGGIVGDTRFVVISSSPRALSGLSDNPGWGLAVLRTGQLFKVSDVEQGGGKTQITLVHVPPGFEEYFHSPDCALFDKWVLPQARTDFKEALESSVIPELLEAEWRQRIARPPGLDNEGRLIAA